MTEKLTLALPKGRVMQEGLGLLQRAGLNLNLTQENRLLKHDAGDAIILELRNSDVPTYVDLGVADAGIVGKDVLLESGSDIYDLVDLKVQTCRLSLIGPKDTKLGIGRVASKYPRLAQDYLRSIGNSSEVIKLSGNVELACLSGLADAAIDIVQTGRTLKDNKLEELAVIMHSSARFVVNRAALKLKSRQLRPLVLALRKLAG